MASVKPDVSKPFGDVAVAAGDRVRSGIALEHLHRFDRDTGATRRVSPS
jgi:hypothetical protein